MGFGKKGVRKMVGTCPFSPFRILQFTDDKTDNSKKSNKIFCLTSHIFCVSNS